MKKSYHINGMTCNGCRSHVEQTLSKIEGVNTASVNLENAEAMLEYDQEISIEKLQAAMQNEGGHYSIHLLGEQPIENTTKDKKSINSHGTGVFYCPMHCEGDKTYEQLDDCPVCGMDLVEEQNLNATTSEQWTCSMHPEIVENEAGDCPICGMDLVPMKPD
ncbi:MAG: heavy metal-binding domain-containing protein, partial [Nonlabens sp.]